MYNNEIQYVINIVVFIFREEYLVQNLKRMCSVCEKKCGGLGQLCYGGIKIFPSTGGAVRKFYGEQFKNAVE